MLNHFHGIIMLINPSSGTMHCATTEDDFKEKFSHPRPNTLGTIIKCFKASVTRRARELKLISKTQPIWHRNFYEHIIRNDRGLYAIQEYIRNNPIYWDWDKNNPLNSNKFYQTTIE